MRPSNNSIAQNVASDILLVVFKTLNELEIQISIQDMRTLMDRVDRRLGELHGEKRPQGQGGRNGQPA